MFHIGWRECGENQHAVKSVVSSNRSYVANGRDLSHVYGVTMPSITSRTMRERNAPSCPGSPRLSRHYSDLVADTLYSVDSANRLHHGVPLAFVLYLTGYRYLPAADRCRDPAAPRAGLHKSLIDVLENLVVWYALFAELGRSSKGKVSHPPSSNLRDSFLRLRETGMRQLRTYIGK